MYMDPYGLFGWADMPLLPQGMVDFSAGFGDSMSFGITGYIRTGLGINSVDKCSNFYRGGKIADVAFGLGTLGLSAGLKSLAANASRSAAREGARPFVNAFREARDGVQNSFRRTECKQSFNNASQRGAVIAHGKSAA
ncbi:hypothetical protein [Ralstonia pseudosolanacearum]|uniref:hypothetical protein n=1 Tax=Ralstonia pseudosolanacearum TaxID=1310165 RepID=UPI0018D15139|nr:hypothetical protein [Ralstonia pseudosolanacearum]